MRDVGGANGTVKTVGGPKAIARAQQRHLDRAPPRGHWTGEVLPYRDFMGNPRHIFPTTDGGNLTCGGPGFCKWCMIAEASLKERRAARRRAFIAARANSEVAK